ncbi:MAG: hypothetical protein G01um10147_496 [Microgenomates group bacterium Gr01-1014_7]|nr:MAG: hypothetical protein G01um10147_496 [Microgenomates group bacterium Gr01-1014_7]
MKLLADENFPPTLISYLQKKRHDIKRIQRSAKGIVDLSVSEKALKESRIVVTFDKDFLKSEQDSQNVRVMIFDFPNMTPEEITPYLDGAVAVINKLRKKKKPFMVIYSKEGIAI